VLGALRFEPIFKPAIWGGDALLPLFGRPPVPDPIGEAWLLSDVDGAESVVQDGPLAGRTLRDLCRDHRDELLGPIPLSLGRFPLLLKLIDARQELSVQVHPTDAQAAERHPGQLGKNEAWVVLRRDPATSKLYVGLAEGVSEPALRQAIADASAASLLHGFTPETGDCVMLDAGTVHAIGRDLLLFEIQQTSDLTYRMFDWGRVDATGKSRPLHVEAALACTDFQRGPVFPTTPRPTARGQELVRCPYFSVERRRVVEPTDVGDESGLSIVVVLDGRAELAGATARAGQVVVLPHVAPLTQCKPLEPTTLLVCRPAPCP
jgi:mannose-6-phosphate isomerase